MLRAYKEGMPRNPDPLRVDWLPDEFTAPGMLGITIAPGRCGRSAIDKNRVYSRDIAADYTRLRALGVSAVVCLQELHEGSYVRDGFGASRATGIERLHLPIRDGGIPASPRALAGLLGWISETLDGGARIVVHCAAGLGRSGLVVGCWLRSQGVPIDRALRVLHEVRGPHCPETEEQRRFIAAVGPYGGTSVWYSTRITARNISRRCA